MHMDATNINQDPMQPTSSASSVLLLLEGGGLRSGAFLGESSSRFGSHAMRSSSVASVSDSGCDSSDVGLGLRGIPRDP